MHAPWDDSADGTQTDGFTNEGKAQFHDSLHHGCTAKRDRKPSAHARALLLGRAEAYARYATQQEAEDALIGELVVAGYDIVQIAALLCTCPAAETLAQGETRTLYAALMWMYNHIYAAQHRASGRWSRDASLPPYPRAWAISLPWPGRHAATDAAILQMHVKLALETKALTYRASRTEFAQAVGGSNLAVRNANYRLVARGLIAIVDPGRGGRAIVYRLSAPCAEMENPLMLPTALGAERTAQDVFGPCGVGRLAGRVYEALLAQPDTQWGLARRTGLSEADVHAGLLPLTLLGQHASGQIEALAFRYEGVWYARRADLAQVAAILFSGR